MSNRATTWAWDQCVRSPMRKLILLKLADNADEISGDCWPSVSHIATMCECDQRTVRRHLRGLEAAGLLRVIVRGGISSEGTRYANRYRVVGDWERPVSGPGPAPAPMPGSAIPEGGADRPPMGGRESGRGAESPKGGAQCPPNPSVNPSRAAQGAGDAASQQQAVPSTPGAWAQHFVQAHGYDWSQAKSAKSMAMYRQWSTDLATVAVIDEAMEIATAKLGEQPGSPVFLRGIVADIQAEADRPAPTGRAKRSSGNSTPSNHTGFANRDYTAGTEGWNVAGGVA